MTTQAAALTATEILALRTKINDADANKLAKWDASVSGRRVLATIDALKSSPTLPASAHEVQQLTCILEDNIAYVDGELIGIRQAVIDIGKAGFRVGAVSAAPPVSETFAATIADLREQLYRETTGRVAALQTVSKLNDVIHEICEAEPRMEGKCTFPKCGCKDRGDWPPGVNPPVSPAPATGEVDYDEVEDLKCTALDLFERVSCVADDAKCVDMIVAEFISVRAAASAPSRERLAEKLCDIFGEYSWKVTGRAYWYKKADLLLADLHPTPPATAAAAQAMPGREELARVINANLSKQAGSIGTMVYAPVTRDQVNLALSIAVTNFRAQLDPKLLIQDAVTAYLSTLTPRTEAAAMEELLPCWCHDDDDNRLLEIKPDEHDKDCPAHYRPTVAALITREKNALWDKIIALAGTWGGPFSQIDVGTIQHLLRRERDAIRAQAGNEG